MIGEIFDKVYQLASLTTEPLSDVQTITVPPGGAAAVDMKLEDPGEYVLVDHALSRAARGLVGKLVVSGENRTELFERPIGKLLSNACSVPSQPIFELPQ